MWDVARPTCSRSQKTTPFLFPQIFATMKYMKDRLKPSLIEKAIRIAASAHFGQTRKADGMPFITHPIAVALKLAKHGFPDIVVAAALVHDVLEDTDYPTDKLKEELGNKAFEIVKTVTNDKSLEWEEKKIKYIENVRKGPEEAKAVAVADKIHNIESLMIVYAKDGPEIWKRFNRGKDKKVWFEKNFLKMIKETWKHPLVKEYEELIKKEEKLK